MKARPSLWNLSPFGCPSYSQATVILPSGAILKSRPQGMSVTQRLPSRSKDGPSRKVGAGSPPWDSAHWLGPERWNSGGILAKTVVGTTGGAANMGLRTLSLIGKGEDASQSCAEGQRRAALRQLLQMYRSVPFRSKFSRIRRPD